MPHPRQVVQSFIMLKFLALQFIFLLHSTLTLSIDEKPVLGYYAESLCPDCMAFSNGPLTTAFTEVPSIFTLNFVPWGNAKIDQSGKFDCQHGEMECIMNTVEACALNYYSNISIFWPFLHCLDGYGTEKNPDVGRKCASQVNMDWEKIDSCRTGTLGHSLELHYANVTSSLDPPHHYTPWITINGKHDTQAEGAGLVEVLCNAYMGQNKPEACRHLNF